MLKKWGFYYLIIIGLTVTKLYSETLNFDKSQWTVNHDLFLVHAIPKCGTHLIQPIVELMTQKTVINRNVTTPHLVDACKNNQILRVFQPLNKNISKVIKNLDHKVIALVRDPRDALISCLFYMRSLSKKPGVTTRRDFFIVGEDFDQCSFDQQLTALIVGDSHSNSYIQYYKDRIGWALKSNAHVVKYEDLVGELGGGNDDVRREVVFNMARFLHVDLPLEEIDKHLEGTYINFGQKEVDGKVFERSTIGNWTTFLNDEQKRLIKKMIGKEIIRLGYERDNNW